MQTKKGQSIEDARKKLGEIFIEIGKSLGEE